MFEQTFQVAEIVEKTRDSLMMSYVLGLLRDCQVVLASGQRAWPSPPAMLEAQEAT